MDYILTPAQFAFMQQHHEQIERSMAAHFTGAQDNLAELQALDEYQRLFGTLLWDDIYDRYQETPGYDPTLRLALRQQTDARSSSEGSAKTTFLSELSELQNQQKAKQNQP